MVYMVYDLKRKMFQILPSLCFYYEAIVLALQSFCRRRMLPSYLIKGYHYTYENIFDKIFSNLIEKSGRIVKNKILVEYE